VPVTPAAIRERLKPGSFGLLAVIKEVRAIIARLTIGLV
jgi:hypothetical protein